jgi:hypothetical protein
VVPVHLQHQLHIDARILRVIPRLSERGVAERRHIEPMPQPVVTRLAERQRRESSTAIERSPAVSQNVFNGALQQMPPQAVPPMRPVAMVLARPAASTPPVAATAQVAVTSGWPEESAMLRRPSVRPGRDTESLEPQIDVRQLTDRVVAVIERRTVSARERLGM